MASNGLSLKLWNLNSANSNPDFIVTIPSADMEDMDTLKAAVCEKLFGDKGKVLSRYMNLFTVPDEEGDVAYKEVDIVHCIDCAANEGDLELYIDTTLCQLKGEGGGDNLQASLQRKKRRDYLVKVLHSGDPQFSDKEKLVLLDGLKVDSKKVEIMRELILFAKSEADDSKYVVQLHSAWRNREGEVLLRYISDGNVVWMDGFRKSMNEEVEFYESDLNLILMQTMKGIQCLQRMEFSMRTLSPESIMLKIRDGRVAEARIWTATHGRFSWEVKGRADRADDDGSVSLQTIQQYAVPNFSAPEILCGDTKQDDMKADLWSVGMIGLWMYWGELPVKFENSVEKISSDLNNYMIDQLEQLTVKVARRGIKYSGVDEENNQDIFTWLEKLLQLDPEKRRPVAECISAWEQSKVFRNKEKKRKLKWREAKWYAVGAVINFDKNTNSVRLYSDFDTKTYYLESVDDSLRRQLDGDLSLNSVARLIRVGQLVSVRPKKKVKHSNGDVAIHATFLGWVSDKELYYHTFQMAHQFAIMNDTDRSEDNPKLFESRFASEVEKLRRIPVEDTKVLQKVEDELLDDFASPNLYGVERPCSKESIMYGILVPQEERNAVGPGRGLLYPCPMPHKELRGSSLRSSYDGDGRSKKGE